MKVHHYILSFAMLMVIASTTGLAALNDAPYDDAIDQVPPAEKFTFAAIDDDAVTFKGSTTVEVRYTVEDGVGHGELLRQGVAIPFTIYNPRSNPVVHFDTSEAPVEVLGDTSLHGRFGILYDSLDSNEEQYTFVDAESKPDVLRFAGETVREVRYHRHGDTGHGTFVANGVAIPFRVDLSGEAEVSFATDEVPVSMRGSSSMGDTFTFRFE